MKLVYITNEDPNSQCDYQEVSMLHGLREVLGDDCIDYPRKKIMYGDFSESPKEELHGWGFSLLTEPIQDIENRKLENIDFVLYGFTDAYGVKNDPALDKLAKYGVWYLDGHDHSNITRTPCFKRELFEEHKNVFPTGFGIPEHRIIPLNFFKLSTTIFRFNNLGMCIINSQNMSNYRNLFRLIHKESNNPFTTP